MKKFNLEEALAGKPVVTAYGLDVEEISLFNPRNVGDGYNVVCAIRGDLYLYTEDGECRSLKSADHLFMKEETITVNGFKVPKPVEVIGEQDEVYYVPDFGSPYLVCETRWDYDGIDYAYQNSGVIHHKRENAIIHAKAMLGIDPYKEEN